MTATRSRARRGQGDALRAEVLQAASELLAETGDESAVSIRGVAERVGVSPPAIYLHFADKGALLHAVCNQVFAGLDAAMEAAAGQDGDPLESLRRRGLAYVAFGRANPEQYRIVMMSRASADPGIAAQAFAHLEQAVRACVDAGIMASGTDVRQAAAVLWSAAHGITSLLVAQPSFPWPADVDALVNDVIVTAGVGLIAAGRGGGRPPEC